jgi:hypothetical protein
MVKYALHNKHRTRGRLKRAPFFPIRNKWIAPLIEGPTHAHLEALPCTYLSAQKMVWQQREGETARVPTVSLSSLADEFKQTHKQLFVLDLKSHPRYVIIRLLGEVSEAVAG